MIHKAQYHGNNLKKKNLRDNAYVILMVVGIWLIAIALMFLIMNVLFYHSNWKSVSYTSLADEITKYSLCIGIILAILFRVFYLKKFKGGIFKSWVFVFALLLCFPALSSVMAKSAMVAYTKHFGAQELLIFKVVEKYKSDSSGYRSRTLYNLRTDNQKYSRIIVSKSNYRQAYVSQTVSLINYKSQFLDYVDFNDFQFVD